MGKICASVYIIRGNRIFWRKFLDCFLVYTDMQRRTRETPVGKTLSCRILVVSSMEDSAEQYVSTMNCIFAAQKNVCFKSHWLTA